MALAVPGGIGSASALIASAPVFGVMVIDSVSETVCTLPVDRRERRRRATHGKPFRIAQDQIAAAIKLSRMLDA